MSKVVEFKTVDGTNALEIVEKRSRFIAVATHVENIEEVDEFLSEVRSKNKGAKHIAYAYNLGKDSVISQNNDDGEPSGSAGVPIFDAIKKHDVTDCVIAVVRYFGGVQLGKSKLTRTYFTVAFECLKRSKIVKMVNCSIFGITLKYPDSAPVGSYLRDNHLPIVSAEYGDVVSLRVAIPKEDVDKHLGEIKTRMAEEFLCSKVDSGFLKFE